jgi:hypothetical protein
MSSFDPPPSPQSSSSSSSSTGTAPAPEKTVAKTLLLVATAVGLVLVVAVGVWRAGLLPDTKPAGGAPPSDMTTSERAWKEKQPFSVDTIDPEGLWIDVQKPQLLRTVFTENTWLTTAATEPLGQGFLGAWAGFLGSPGEDLGLQKLTQGLVGQLVADALLVQPLRLVWFAREAGAPPALVVPSPEASLTRAYAAFRGAVERGGYDVVGCPGETPPSSSTPEPEAGAGAGAGADAGVVAVPNPNRIEVSRLVVADQAVYAALARDRLVFSKDVQAVVSALCGENRAVSVVTGADVVLGMSPTSMGREVEVLSGLLGLQGAPALAFAVEGSSLRPVGLAGTFAVPGRLDTVAIPATTWALVPEDLPVAAAFNMRLPRELSTENLTAFYAARPAELSTRQVLVLWQPHGDPAVGTEVAVVWSDVADEPALRQMLRGNNPLQVRVVCDHVVASSTAALLSRIEASCTQKAPSMTFAAPGIVKGLKEKTSVGLLVDFGRLLSGLLEEGFALDQAAKKVRGEVPAEIDAARKRLRELPRFGLFGQAQGQVLSPWGFSS